MSIVEGNKQINYRLAKTSVSEKTSKSPYFDEVIKQLFVWGGNKNWEDDIIKEYGDDGPIVSEKRTRRYERRRKSTETFTANKNYLKKKIEERKKQIEKLQGESEILTEIMENINVDEFNIIRVDEYDLYTKCEYRKPEGLENPTIYDYPQDCLG